MSAHLVVGLTGGIGSGKSAVCREFERLGVPIIDADLIAREVVVPGSDGLREIVEMFGTEILAEDQTLNRSKLRSIVFADEDKRSALEAIVHPKIKALTQSRLNEIDAPYCIWCVPLLVEGEGYKTVDRVLVIDCPVETQIERVTARDSMSRAQALAIIETQATREQRLEVADDIIDNSVGLEALRAPVESLHKKYMTLAKSSSAT